MDKSRAWTERRDFNKGEFTRTQKSGHDGFLAGKSFPGDEDESGYLNAGAPEREFSMEGFSEKESPSLASQGEDDLEGWPDNIPGWTAAEDPNSDKDAFDTMSLQDSVRAVSDGWPVSGTNRPVRGGGVVKRKGVSRSERGRRQRGSDKGAGDGRFNRVARGKRLALQTLLCILAMFLAIAVKQVDFPAAAQMRNQIDIMLTFEPDLETAYSRLGYAVNRFVDGLFPLQQEERSAGGEEAVDPEQGEEVFWSINEGLIYDEAAPSSQVAEQAEKPASSNAGKTSGTLEGSQQQSAAGTGAMPVVMNTAKPIVQQATTMSSTAATVQFLVPVTAALGSPFGERKDPFTNLLKVHKGIDLKANNGDSIKAAMAGDVLVATYEKTFGNYIKLKHSGGFHTLYAHCSKLLVKSGQKVKQGDVIAYVGNTGASLGPHLHFEIWKDGVPVNPLNYIKVRTQ